MGILESCLFIYSSVYLTSILVWLKAWKPNYLFAMNLVLWAYLRVLSVSSKFVSDGERQASIRVRAFPPKESYKNKITLNCCKKIGNRGNVIVSLWLYWISQNYPTYIRISKKNLNCNGTQNQEEMDSVKIGFVIVCLGICWISQNYPS